jgi:endoglucanase
LQRRQRRECRFDSRIIILGSRTQEIENKRLCENDNDALAVTSISSMLRRKFVAGASRLASVVAIFAVPRGLLPRGLLTLEQASPASQGGAVRVNQAGYLPHRAKQLSVVSAAGGSFVLRSVATGEQLFKGALSEPRSDAASGDTVRTIDISRLKSPGEYRVEIAPGVAGPNFSVGDGVYREPLRMAMRAFYGQRCGCAVDLGGGYSHPPCHLTGAYHPSSGREGSFANYGGWHDAGDYGRYVVNSGISTGTLLWAWELFAPPLKNLHLAIPESGGKVPDYLAEVRWNLEWMLAMQDADGGVWHKQTSEHFCAFIMPQADTLTSYVIGTGSAPYKSTCATADVAAVMAIAARCYGPYDDAFAQRCLLAARKAWSWATANPDVTFRNPPGIATGEYGGRCCGDELLWATAELWRTTGESRYRDAFVATIAPRVDSLAANTPAYAMVSSLAYWTYMLAERQRDPHIAAAIENATNSAAENLMQTSRSNGYANTLRLTDYTWGSNSVAANGSLLLLIAHRFHPNPDYVETALNNLHYLLGRNCFGISWVSQVGFNPFQHPHHRPSVADGIAAPWPGLMSGGPNAHPADPVAEKLPTQPPMRMYVDDSRAYSLNEVAINWNAPLVFLLAGVN